MPNTDATQILAGAAARESAAAAVAWEETKNVNKILRSHILEENERLREENKVIPGLRTQNERLKVCAEFAIIGDILLAIGSIGFGFLGTYGQNILSKSEQANLCLISFSIALLIAAIIGLALKVFQWVRQISSK